MALHSTLSSVSLLYWGAQNWTQHPRCGLTSAELRGRITFLELLAVLYLMQPRIPLAFCAARAHYWLMFNLVPTRILRSFFARLLSSWVAPSIYWGGILPQVQVFALLLVELHEVPLSLFLQPVEVPLDGSTTLWCISHPSQFLSSANVLRLTMSSITFSSQWKVPFFDLLAHKAIQATCQGAEQPQVPQPLPISLVLQTLPQLRCPSLDTLQPLNVSLGVRGPTLNTAFEVRPHQCRVQGDDHCPSPAGHTISDTSQDAIGLLGHLGTLLAHIQPAVDQHPQVLLHQAAFQPLFPKPAALHGVVVTQVQDPALSRVEPHTIGLGPSIQPVQVPLQSLPILKRSTLPPSLVSSANGLRVHSIPSSRSLIKTLNRTGPNTEPWGTPLVTGCHWS
ncbi:hypothetical protein QYF61_006427 [Mycteria americana]|uniref:Uncharacterized protein n=1 Tax=Mycteria americana TaxID=33587 RepID=A0AAN7MNJ2_MYCAM|nr:hypothetical protein QYF61_006427 [Mycteria americana]